MDNIIRAVFCGSRYATAKSAWLIDHGMVLQIKGVELPEVYEVDFSNSKTEKATRVLGGPDGVVIPDKYFLSKAQQIYAWVYLTTGDSVVIPWEYMRHGQKEVFVWVYLTPDAASGYTLYQVTIPLNLRSDVSDVEPTPEQEESDGE